MYHNIGSVGRVLSVAFIYQSSLIWPVHNNPQKTDAKVKRTSGRPPHYSLAITIYYYIYIKYITLLFDAFVISYYNREIYENSFCAVCVCVDDEE